MVKKIPRKGIIVGWGDDDKVRKIVNFKIDFLSIDTEGFDNQIIKSWPWEKTKPQVICIEKISRQNIKMLENKGYQLREKTPANLIFVRF